MLTFPASNEIEIFVNVNNKIAIKEYDQFAMEEKVIELTKDQFSELLACGESLLLELEDSELESKNA